MYLMEVVHVNLCLTLPGIVIYRTNETQQQGKRLTVYLTTGGEARSAETPTPPVWAQPATFS